MKERGEVSHLLSTGTDQKKNHTICKVSFASLELLFLPMHFAVKRKKGRIRPCGTHLTLLPWRPRAQDSWALSTRNPRGHQRLEQLCKAASSLNKEKGERHLQGEEEVMESREWRRRPRNEGQVSKSEGSEVPRGKAAARSRAQSGLRRC